MPELIRPVYIDGNPLGDDYLAVGDYLSRDQSDTHTVTRAFIPEVAGSLIVGESKTVLKLVGEHTAGTVERHVGRMKNGVSVSTSSGRVIDVIVHPERFDSKLLSRGLAWVRVSQETPPRFLLDILPNHGIYDQEDIARRLGAAELCAQLLIADVLNSVPTPAYADRFPDDDSNPNYNLAHGL